MKLRSKGIAVLVSSAVVLATGTGIAQAAIGNDQRVITERHITEKTAKIEQAQTNGKDLFRGIFFLQGGVGDKLMGLPIFTGDQEMIDRNNSPEAMKAVDQITAKMEKTQPGFFADFEKEVRSGDPVRVSRAVENSVALAKKAAPEQVSTKETNGDAKPTCGVTVAVGLAVVHAAAAFTAAGVAVAETVAVGHFLVYGSAYFWPNKAASASELGQDQKLAQLLNTLRTA
ncbi:SdpC family antimicrobial peptide [Saccharopolyspora lacisalsi]|uniref:SdpC family antimicrobial peptide n=1 Tax=Halosaccharopolyspora lacisalsi TaxID=1000566 RepID=A0A839E9P7_9PSEU|nr:sporulation delaying protein family toxin [Halosaccharopolyspora lacisalsi]MBA8827568.1 SdpC family antimicrobial peptide [Halosaccharopolyspora lacisalsi]